MDLETKIAKIEKCWRKRCKEFRGELHVPELLSLLAEKIAKKIKRGKFQLRYVDTYAKDVWQNYWSGNQCGIKGAPRNLERRPFNEKYRATPSAVHAIDDAEARGAAASPEWAHFILWIEQDQTYSDYLDRYGFTNTRKGREAFKSVQHAYNARFDRGDAWKVYFVGVTMTPEGYITYIRDVDREFFDRVFATQLEAAEWIEGGREECGLPPLNVLPPFDFSWANAPPVFLRVA